MMKEKESSPIKREKKSCRWETTLRDNLTCDGGPSLLKVAKGAGVEYKSLHRFVHQETDIHLETAQLLWDYLFGKPHVPTKLERLAAKKERIAKSVAFTKAMNAARASAE